MKKLIKVGSTNQTLDIFIQDSSASDGSGLTGLVYNSSGLTCYYRKGATGSATQLTLATQTVGGAHSDGGFVEVDATNMPGIYRLDLSDTIVDTNGTASLLLKGATNMVPVPIELQVVQFDPEQDIGDAVLTRDVDNVEATANEHTLCTLILAGLEWSVSGTTWTIKRTDGSTTHATKTLTTSASADSVTGVQ